VTGESLFWLRLVPVSWLVLFVPVSKFTILEGTPVREYPTNTRSKGAVVLVLVPVSLLVPVSDKDLIGHDRFWE
jgi:hypothetical protein